MMAVCWNQTSVNSMFYEQTDGPICSDCGSHNVDEEGEYRPFNLKKKNEHPYHWAFGKKPDWFDESEEE